MEFLVNIEINWPPGSDPDLKDELFAAELLRGQQLARQGKQIRLWRVPGRWANWSLWEVQDATELHSAITSLPLYPWMDVKVHALAQHVNDPKLLGIENERDE
jgi:muconolactone D-isomerase